MHEFAPPYQVLRPGRVLVDHGPMTMIIEAARQGSPLTEAAVAGAKRAVEVLSELVPWLPVARTAVGQLGQVSPDGPEALRRMVAAVRVLGEPDFTPMAAVAGAFAELVAEAALATGATRVIVNNGGDISLHAPPGERIRVGIVTDLAARRCTHVLEVTGESGIRGIATSGFGGRSLTKGIASSAVAIARTASVADALATALGNATTCDHPAIRRCLAEELDPGTDIRGHMVTCSISGSGGELPVEAKEEALRNGARRASALHQQGSLLAWALCVGDRLVSFPKDLLLPLEQQV